jgi:hypothetical protein
LQGCQKDINEFARLQLRLDICVFWSISIYVHHRPLHNPWYQQCLRTEYQKDGLFAGTPSIEPVLQIKQLQMNTQACLLPDWERNWIAPCTWAGNDDCTQLQAVALTCMLLFVMPGSLKQGSDTAVTLPE